MFWQWPPPPLLLLFLHTNSYECTEASCLETTKLFRWDSSTHLHTDTHCRLGGWIISLSSSHAGNLRWAQTVVFKVTFSHILWPFNGSFLWCSFPVCQLLTTSDTKQVKTMRVRGFFVERRERHRSCCCSLNYLIEEAVWHFIQVFFLFTCNFLLHDTAAKPTASQVVSLWCAQWIWAAIITLWYLKIVGEMKLLLFY